MSLSLADAHVVGNKQIVNRKSQTQSKTKPSSADVAERGVASIGVRSSGNQEEEEEDLFVFNDTIQGPRAPAVKLGRITQA